MTPVDRDLFESSPSTGWRTVATVMHAERGATHR